MLIDEVFIFYVKYVIFFVFCVFRFVSYSVDRVIYIWLNDMIWWILSDYSLINENKVLNFSKMFWSYEDV